MRRVIRLVPVLIFMGAAALLGGAWLFGSPTDQILWHEAGHRSPHELIRYLMRRLEGHPRLEAILLPPLHVLQRRIEREPPPGLPSLGKGQQPHPLGEVVQGIERVWQVSSPQEILQALHRAPAGTRIVIAPGIYPFDQNIGLGNDGTPRSPIMLSAARPGTVWLHFSQSNGIVLNRPYWVFENLDIRGTCTYHDRCEHAFHVTGRGAHAIIRNNRISDFNAHVKVNGYEDRWPDHGLLAYNTLTNTAARETDLPVTPFDLVGANYWRVQDNVVSHFVKRQGNRVSYGIFMKGASEGGRIERNLVICSPSDISDAGVRVGISFGGGGTGSRFCREQGCVGYEHREGLAANNIVAHCNDTALDVNSSTRITLAHNTLINTSGIAVRGVGRHAQAYSYGNLYEGVLRARDGTRLVSEMDQAFDANGAFESADALQLRWQQPPETILRLPQVVQDFGLHPRKLATLPGAMTIDGGIEN